jgi:hypothetical protein
MTAINLYRRLRELQPEQPLLTGTVLSAPGDGTARVQATSGGIFVARNPLNVAAGKDVFYRDSTITGEAPALTYVLIEV